MVLFNIAMILYKVLDSDPSPAGISFKRANICSLLLSLAELWWLRFKLKKKITSLGENSLLLSLFLVPRCSQILWQGKDSGRCRLAIMELREREHCPDDNLIPFHREWSL